MIVVIDTGLVVLKFKLIKDNVHITEGMKCKLSDMTMDIWKAYIPKTEQSILGGKQKVGEKYPDYRFTRGFASVSTIEESVETLIGEYHIYSKNPWGEKKPVVGSYKSPWKRKKEQAILDLWEEAEEYTGVWVLVS